LAVLALGIETPRIFLRDLRAVSAAPPASPASPAPAAIAGIAAFFAISPTLVPPLRRACELGLDDFGFGLDDFALVVFAEVVFGLRLLVVDRVLDARAPLVLRPLLLRPFFDLVDEFERELFRVDELLVCWAMVAPLSSRES
jgi:hypothetical protein